MKIRRILSTAISVCTLACCAVSPCTAIAADTSQPMFGDSNLDQTVDIADAVLTARFVGEDPEARISAAGQRNADANQDTVIDNQDVIAILQYIAKLRSELGISAGTERREAEYKAVNLTADADTIKIASKKADDKFLNSQFNLTVNLLHEANADADGGNMMISPLSVSQALAMTANGAKGQTQAEMTNILGGDLTMDDLNAYYYDYTHSLKNTDNAMLKQANSIWIRDNEQRIIVPDTFLQIAKSGYDAQVFRAAFDDSTATDINNWVKFHTDEMIPKLLDKINDDAIMYLINALAFDAKWASPYQTYDVGEHEFTKADGTKVTAMLMYGNEYSFLQDRNAVGFVKPYRDGNYSFAAILPNADITLDDYIKNMTGESLQKLLNSRVSEPVQTALPKFSFDYGIALKEPLKKLGMQTAFNDAEADLTGLNERGGFIGQVLHKTHIDVDEEGTKAAAVTVVEVCDNAAMRTQQEVILDRPFLFMILDENTKLPVFIGTVNDPTE